LLLLTNDGEFTNLITSARNQIAKVYKAKVQGSPSDRAIDRLRRGIRIDEGTRTAPAEVHKIRESESNSWFEVVLHEGRNQQVRKMFDAIGHSVVKLRRTRIGELEDKNLRVGEWRKLTEIEVKRFKKSKRPNSGRHRRVRGLVR